MGIERVSARAIKQCTITVQKGAFMVQNAAHARAPNIFFKHKNTTEALHAQNISIEYP